MSTKSKILNKLHNNNKSSPNVELNKEDFKTKIFSNIEKGNYYEACNALLALLPEEKRLKYVLEKFEGSQFKTYSLGMTNLRITIENYLNTKNTSEIKEKYKLLNYSSEFDACTASFYSSIIENRHTAISLAYTLARATKPNVQVSDCDEATKKYIPELLTLVYPENKGFRLLFI